MKNNAYLVISKNIEKTNKIIENSKKEYEINNTLKLDCEKIDAEQMYLINDFLNTSSLDGKKKLLLLLNFNFMSIQYQNKLLKSIEENPYEIQIVLFSESENDVIETIKSRVQIISTLISEKNVNEIEINYADKILLNIIEKKEEMIWFDLIEANLTRKTIIRIFLLVINNIYKSNLKEDLKTEIIKIINKYIERSKFETNMKLILNALEIKISRIKDETK